MTQCTFKIIKNLQDKKEEWLNTRMGKFCGSDVGVIVRCFADKEDLIRYGGTIEEETSFVTPLMMYLTKKYNATIPEPDKQTATSQQFGKDMEKSLVDIFNLLNIDKKAEFSRDFYVSTDKAHPFGCSPDGFVSLDLETNIQGLNSDELITKKDGDGLLEIKTMRVEDFRGKEPSWAYILQVQWNMFCTAKKWGVLFATAPKSYEICGDNYIKGRIAGYALRGDIKYVIKMMDFKAFYYRYDPEIIAMIMRAIMNFINSMNLGILPPASTSRTKLQIEADMLNSIFIKYMLPQNQEFQEKMAEDFDKLAMRYLKTSELRKKLEKKELIYKNELQYQSISRAFKDIDMKAEFTKKEVEHKRKKENIDCGVIANELPMFAANFDDKISDIAKESMISNFFQNHSVIGGRFGYIKQPTERGIQFTVAEREKIEKKIRIEIEKS